VEGDCCMSINAPSESTNLSMPPYITKNGISNLLYYLKQYSSAFKITLIVPGITPEIEKIISLNKIFAS